MSDRTHPDSGPVTPGEAGFTASDMATAAAQGFRDGVASVVAENTNTERDLGFSLENRGGVWVVQDSMGGCRPASLYEQKLWAACQEARASLSLPAAGQEPVATQPTPDVAAKMQSNTWDHFGDILPTLKAISRGDWYWGANSRCKYIEIRLDTRDGGCLIYDRERVRISPEQFAHQGRAMKMEPWPVHSSLSAAQQPAVAAGWSEGIQAAAKLLEKKADDFAKEHGYNDMGGLSFGRGANADVKLDYHSGLLELAEEVRAMNEHAVHPANDGTHVLMEHSGCGRGTQVDTLMVRLNPGDKVIFHQGPITRAMLKAAPLPPAPSTEGESNG